MSPPLELPLRRTRLVLLALLCLIFVAGGVAFTLAIGLPSPDFTRNRPVEELLRSIGLLGAGLFGSCFVVIAGLALRRGPGLVIDDEGIVEHTSGRAAGRVRWEEVTGVRLIRGASGPLVGVDLADVEAHLDRLPGWRRWIVRSNVATGSPPVTIDPAPLGQDPRALVSLLLAERARRTGLPPLADDADALAG